MEFTAMANKHASSSSVTHTHTNKQTYSQPETESTALSADPAYSAGLAARPSCWGPLWTEPSQHAPKISWRWQRPPGNGWPVTGPHAVPGCAATAADGVWPVAAQWRTAWRSAARWWTCPCSLSAHHSGGTGLTAGSGSRPTLAEGPGRQGGLLWRLCEWDSNRNINTQGNWLVLDTHHTRTTTKTPITYSNAHLACM